MDCFYAAVEMRDRPDLRDRPMAVGGRPESRGVITTCNYKARDFGVHSALSSREALRRCPDLVILPTRFSKYKEVSRAIRAIFDRFSETVEPISLDEAYLDVTNNRQFDGNATQTARAIRAEIESSLGLTASAGISNSKFLAKIASDWKKPNNQFTIAPPEIPAFMKNLPVQKIPGVGKATLAKMHKLDILNCQDLQALSVQQLTHQFGEFGIRLFDLSRGIDHSRVRTGRARKSISVETTLAKDLELWEGIEKHIHALFDELMFRMKKSKVDPESIKSIGVKFKSSEFQVTSKESARPCDKDNFVKLAKQHFFDSNISVRLIGIGCKLNVKEPQKSRHQLRLF